MDKWDFVHLCKTKMNKSEYPLVTCSLANLLEYEHELIPHKPKKFWNHLKLQSASRSETELWIKYITIYEKLLVNYTTYTTDDIKWMIEDAMVSIINGDYNDDGVRLFEYDLANE